jgi:hypothetical protein
MGRGQKHMRAGSSKMHGVTGEAMLVGIIRVCGKDSADCHAARPLPTVKCAFLRAQAVYTAAALQSTE